MAVPFLDLGAHFRPIADEVRKAVDRVFETQRFIFGDEVVSLEQEIASYCHCSEGIGVSSGTDALIVSLMALGIGSGDEVITTPFTFVATAGAIARTGAHPKFVDIDAATFNICPRSLESAFTARTKAIMPVHLYGQVADIDPIMSLAKMHDVHVIEDAAQAIGAEYHGRRACSFGDLGCLSFFPSKNLGGAGDGGMVVTRDETLAERVRLLRNHGQKPKYYSQIVGGNFRLDAIQAAVLRVKLRYLDEWSVERQKNAALYRDLFAQSGIVRDLSANLVDGVVLPDESDRHRHVYHQFAIRAARRDELRQALNENKIGHEVYYPLPLHLQPSLSHLGYREGQFPVAERAAKETLALPIYPGITEQMIESVVSVVARFYGSSING